MADEYVKQAANPGMSHEITQETVDSKSKQNDCQINNNASTTASCNVSSHGSEMLNPLKTKDIEEIEQEGVQQKGILTLETQKHVSENVHEKIFKVMSSTRTTSESARSLAEAKQSVLCSEDSCIRKKDENHNNNNLSYRDQAMMLQRAMDVDPKVEIMSSTLTEVVMHAESSAWNIIQISSETGTQRRNPKRSQTCITRTISLNLEIPNKKISDMNMHYCQCMLQLEEDKQQVTLAQAIIHKYIEETVSEEVPCTSSLIIVSTPRSSLPPTLVLNDCDITCAGDLDSVRSVCLGVRELDIAQNKITELNEVQKILNTMQRLSFLNLSSNNFSNCTSFPMETITLETMKWLVLNSTFIPWLSLEGMLHFMPNLEELYLSLNNYNTISLAEDKVMPNIHVLHISGNPLHNFDDILRLGLKFPNLETLVMADCFISRLGDRTKLRSTFEKLHSFNISNNTIDSWEEIDKLQCFPALSDLRLLGQPLLEVYAEKERRQLVIARLGTIDRLNGSRISEEERQDAERAFIRYYMQEAESHRPSRYAELINKHGHLDPLVNIDLRPQTSVEILIRYGEKTELRTLNVRQTVQTFKMSLQEFTGLLPAQMRIYYVDKEIEEFIGEEELKYNTKMLYTYNVRDGDEFHVDRKR